MDIYIFENYLQTEPKIYSFDADFQLVRKASAGRQWEEPKHQNKFFLDQSLVDCFVDQNVNQQKLDVVNIMLDQPDLFLPNDVFLVTFDASNMYTNLENDEILEATKRALKNINVTQYSVDLVYAWSNI